MRGHINRPRRGALVLGLTMALVLPGACGDDDNSNGASVAPSTNESVALSADEKAQLEERLAELATEQVQQSGSVSGGGYGYSTADGTVAGYPSDWQTAIERCQAVADALGELDGPPGSVPIEIHAPRNDGTGEYDVLAAGRGGGTCEER